MEIGQAKRIVIVNVVIAALWLLLSLISGKTSLRTTFSKQGVSGGAPKIFDPVLFVIAKIEVFLRSLAHISEKSDHPFVCWSPAKVGCSGKNAVFEGLTFFERISAILQPI